MMELAAILGALVAVLGYLLRAAWKANAKNEQALEAWQRKDLQRKEGENAAADERKATDGLSDDDIAERLRRRSDVWRGL